MTYNTLLTIRGQFEMTATAPPDATLTAWQLMADNLIHGHNISPNAFNASVIEMNRIGNMYNQARKKTGDDRWKISTGKMDPLTDAEKSDIDVDEIQVDSVPMNGQRYSSGGRR